MNNVYIIIQAIYYILSKIGHTDKLKIIKLLYLADKYHLIRFGRTISRDTYYAMEIGPVGSIIKDVLTFDESPFTPSEYSYLTSLLEKIDDNTFKINENMPKIDSFKKLSKTDKDSIDFVLEHFNKMDQFELVKYTHKYPEWKTHEKKFKENLSRREKIDTVELISVLNKDDILGMPPEHMEEARNILNGDFD